MNESHHGWKVGLFVAIGLALLAALLLNFSKGLSLFTPTYSVKLKATSVGGLKKNANVLLSGVPVGRVSGFDVAPDGKGVVIYLTLESKYKDRIHADARFAIEQLGLLGDQYVEITPQENKAGILQPGATITAEQPLSIQETARSAKDLLALASQTLKNFNEVMVRIDKTVLSERALTNVSSAIDNFRNLSDRAGGMLRTVDGLVQTNGPVISQAISNLSRFANELENLSGELTQTVVTNRVELTKAVKSLEGTSRVLQNLANEVESGKGFAGLMLKDGRFREELSVTASNLAVFSQSLNEHGLFRNLFFKPKPPALKK